MQRHGLEPILLETERNYWGGVAEERQILQCLKGKNATKKNPTCVFCANSSLLFDLMSTLSRNGLAVPRDLSVSCFGEVEQTHQATDLGLSKIVAVSAREHEMGRVAANRLLARAGGDKTGPTLTLVDTSIVGGDSARNV
jgi:DNA-binding LacI/PurR family transcriptional regulator